MPRSLPFVESDLTKRQRFGFGPVNDPRALEKLDGNYDKALRSLGVGNGLRKRCEEELDCILRLYRLDKLVEQQETPGRKAQAFQKEQRWRKQRERSRKRAPRLPPGLLQELWREVLRGRSPDGALLTDVDVARLTGQALAELSQEPSNPGRIKSYALTHAVRGLQGFASRYGKDLAWARGERPPPPQLVAFIRDTLASADIPCPDEHNQDRLVALMVSPRQRIEPPPPS